MSLGSEHGLVPAQIVDVEVGIPKVIEAMTNTEEVPSRVTVLLADGRELVARVDHPRGSPHRRMSWDELRALFHDTIADTLPVATAAKVVDRWPVWMASPARATSRPPS